VVHQRLVDLAAQALAALVHHCGLRFVDRGPHGVVKDSDPLADRGVAGHGFVLQNDALRVSIDEQGLVTKLIDVAIGRDAVPEGQPGNLLQLFRDTPTQWDAWDIDEHYRRSGTELREAESVELIEEHEHRASVRVNRRFGASSLSQVLTLEGDSAALDIVTTVQWHERQKMLKLTFPLDVHADRAASEIQFGHVYRPTHANTSWDAARFETCAHRWVHVGEPGFGVAIANNSTYGHDITRSTRPDAGTTTLVRQTLLRAPLFPDPTADQGTHVLRTSIRIANDVLDAVSEGYRVNLPLRVVDGAAPVAPLVVSGCRRSSWSASSWPRIVRAISWCASTRRVAPRPRALSPSAVTSRASSRRTSWSAPSTTRPP
jgi:alpha-mannosidase